MASFDWSALLPFGTLRAVPAGTLLYLQSQPAQALYYLRSGSVKSVILSDRGEEKILRLYEAGEIFGEASFFDGLPRISTAVALTDCRVVRLGREQLATAFASLPQLGPQMLRYLALTVRLLSEHVNSMAFLGARQRVVQYLLALPRRDGSVRVTQEEIAEAVSLSRVSVSRILRRLRDEGLVQTGYGAIRLCDPAALAAQLQQPG